MIIFISIAKFLARIIYFFLKLRPTKNKVTMISRVNKTTSIDFTELEKEIKKQNKFNKIVILNHKYRNRKRLIIDVLEEMYHMSNSKALIIDSYIIPVSILKHKKNLQIIQIWHALGAIKKFGHSSLDKKEGAKKEIARTMNMHKNYSYIIAGGEKTIPYYAEAFKTSADKIKPLGLPRVDYLLKNKGKSEELFLKYPELNNKRNILYAPTFRRGGKVQYQNIIENFDFEKYNLIIKKHPQDKTKLQNDDRVIYIKGFSIFELLVSCDVLITDYSALSMEAAIINKPVFFYIYDIEEYEENRGTFFDLASYFPDYVSKDITVILNQLDKKYNFKQLEKYKTDFVKINRKTSAEKILNLI